MGEDDLFKELYNLIQKVENTNIVVVQLGERLVGIGDRVEKVENATASLIQEFRKTQSVVCKEASCPYKFKFSVYDEYCKDQERRIGNLENGLSYYKGAIWAIGIAVTLMSPILIWILNKVW